jgi:periplasmic protein CpxP/Spy
MRKGIRAGLALAAALSIATPLAAYAWGGKESCGAGRQAVMMHEHGMQRAIAGLELTEDQQAKLAGLREARAGEMREQFQAMREARRELRTLGFSADYDETKAQALAQRAGEANARMAALQAKAAQDFYQLLTPEQREKAGEAFARMQQEGKGPGHGMKRGHGHGHGHGRHPSS